MKQLQDHVPLWLVILIVLVLFLGALVISFPFLDNTKATSLVGGLIGGLVVYIANFISEKWALAKLFEFQRMGIRNILRNRHDKIYYRDMLANASNEVKVMGASCSRFIDDFLDMDSDDKILIDRLRQHPKLIVQLLIPNNDNMGDDARNRFAIVTQKLTRVRHEFNERVQIRRFSHKVRHSFVISDADLVAGPIFSEDKSRHAPAVHIGIDTDFGKKYREHFVRIWEQCEADENFESCG